MSEPFRLNDYLARIGFAAPLATDLATLAALQSAHVGAIPFEGFDPLFARPVKLDIASVQAKLVGSRRGGYCFEHNTLFKAALEAIGFHVTGLGARVRWMSPPDAPLGPREHMLLKVDLPQGTFIVDVGFGACVLETPLRLAPGAEQATAMGTFKLTEADGLYWLHARQPEGWRVMYAFDLTPQIPADYALANWYTSTNPAAPFLHMLIVERLTPDKRYKLINTRFAVEARDGAVVEERTLTSAGELAELLDKTFNVTFPVPAEDLFARISAPA